MPEKPMPRSPALAALLGLLLAACGDDARAPATCTDPVLPGALVPACSGTACGALDATRYSGSGVGIWRFDNGSCAARTLDVSISGVSGGQEVTLLFSNGGTEPASLPVAGTPMPSPTLAPASPGPIHDLDPARVARDEWHRGLLEENRALGVTLGSAGRGATPPGPTLAPPTLARPAAAPVALGDARTWQETFGPPAGKAYPTVARATCSLPGGRQAVFWVDPDAESSGSMTPDALAYLSTTFCGATGDAAGGGYGRLRSLLGDPWGTVSPSLAGILIPDSPSPQDVNLVFLEVPTTPGVTKTWAGYFWSGNNFLKGAAPSVAASNEALVFFVDASLMLRRPGYLSYLGAVLLHELTHMINFYQRPVLRSVSNDVWLEETTATMTEDIVVPAATPDGYLVVPPERIQPYVASGGGMTYTGWDYPAQYTYAVAGSFGAFLDRRYGTRIQSGTIGCATGGVGCLDGVIRAAGGAGFADEFARMGASIFALLPGTGTPEGFGFPQRVSGAYTLPSIDVTAYAALRRPTASVLLDFPGGSHTYALGTVPAGRTTYSRTGVSVPPGTTLLVVVR